MDNHLFIPVEIYRRGVTVFLGSKKELVKYLRAHGPDVLEEIEDELSMSGSLGLCFKLDAGESLVWCHKNVALSTIVHELAHASFHMLKAVGIPLSENGEEYTYLLEFLCERTFQWLNLISSCDAPSLSSSDATLHSSRLQNDQSVRMLDFAKDTMPTKEKHEETTNKDAFSEILKRIEKIEKKLDNIYDEL